MIYMTTYDNYNNNYCYPNNCNVYNYILILSQWLGFEKKKNGRHLLLSATHQWSCCTHHDSFIAQNLVHDVKLTDCVLRYHLSVTCSINIINLH